MTDRTITFEPYSAMQCVTCKKWIDQTRIVYSGATGDHYEEAHPAIYAEQQVGVPYSFWNETEITVDVGQVV